MCSIIETEENKLILDNNLVLTQHNGFIDIPKDCMEFTIRSFYTPVIKVFEILRSLGINKSVFTENEIQLINKWMEV